MLQKTSKNKYKNNENHKVPFLFFKCRCCSRCVHILPANQLNNRNQFASWRCVNVTLSPSPALYLSQCPTGSSLCAMGRRSPVAVFSLSWSLPTVCNCNSVCVCACVCSCSHMWYISARKIKSIVNAFFNCVTAAFRTAVSGRDSQGHCEKIFELPTINIFEMFFKNSVCIDSNPFVCDFFKCIKCLPKTSKEQSHFI